MKNEVEQKKKEPTFHDRHSVSFPLRTKKRPALQKKEPAPCSKNKEASVKAALQRSFFRNTTGENQETGRAHSRTDDNKQVAEKRGKKKKKWCLKRYPKNDVTTGGKNARSTELLEGRKKGTS